MSNDSSSHAECLSSPEPAISQLPVSPQGDHIEAQVNSQVSENVFSANRITLIIGPEEKVYEVNEHIIRKIPFFGNAFKAGVFREGVEGKMSLPEDDPALFERMLEFVCTGDYFPHVVPSLDPCDRSYKDPRLFQHKHRLRDFSEPIFCDEKENEQHCNTVETAIEVIVDPLRNTSTAFKHMDDRLGRWQTTEATHTLFEQEVLLFCMAEKFIMDDLKELCYRKIMMFPQGPKELAVLANHVPAKLYRRQNSDFYNINFKMQELLSHCIQYHQPFFDEWRSYHRFYKCSPHFREYTDYMNLLEQEMTPHGATLFHAMANARDNVENRTRTMYAWWTCQEERIAILQSDFTDEEAKYYWLQHAKLTDENADDKVPNTLRSDNLIKGFEFCEGKRGDTISRITVDKPIKGMAYGFNVSRDQWGFYLRKKLRFLETESWRDCICDDCQPPSFSMDGRRIYMHDPNDEGLPYRPGNRQKEIEKARKARE